MAQTLKYMTENGANGHTGVDLANAWGYSVDADWADAVTASNGNTLLLFCYAGTVWNTTKNRVWATTGGSTSQFNSIIGASAGGIIDGTICQIDGGGDAGRGLQATGNYFEIRNVKYSTFVGGGIQTTGTNGVIVNVEGSSCSKGLWIFGTTVSIRRCRAHSNTEQGIIAPSYSLVMGNETFSNAGAGLEAGSYSSVIHNISAKSTGINISVGTYTQVLHNIADEGDTHGIQLGTACQASMNKVTNNVGDGIYINGSVISEDFNAFFNNNSPVNWQAYNSIRQGENDITLSEDYYNDDASNDYTSSSDDPSVGFEYPVGNSAVNIGYESCNLPAEYTSAGGSLIDGDLIE